MGVPVRPESMAEWLINLNNYWLNISAISVQFEPLLNNTKQAKFKSTSSGGVGRGGTNWDSYDV